MLWRIGKFQKEETKKDWTSVPRGACLRLRLTQGKIVMALSERGKEMISDQVAIRATWPSHTAKWLARMMRIPLPTARFWTERTVPVYRQHELGLLLIEEFHKHTKWREEELFPKLCQMAGLVNDGVESVPASGQKGGEPSKHPIDGSRLCSCP
jgi:hypothetical protein